MTLSSNAAVVVTFNRKQLLTECVDALLHQSLPPNAIFIVDNASSDGTKTYLKERGYLENPLIRYIGLPQNIGGAGGFHVGMDAAHKAGFDWLWVMDDDTEPYPDSLEIMERFKHYAEVVAIANAKVDRFGKKTADGLRLYSRQHTTPYTKVRFSSFVGLLIRSCAIDRIGLPISDFFIHRDDTEYCMRLRSIGDIALASESTVAHKEVARCQKSRQIFSHVFYQKEIEAYCFDYYGYRNTAWIEQNYRKNPIVRYLLLTVRFLCFTAAVLVFDVDHRWLRIKILAKANLDGVCGHFDNGFPQRLREQLKAAKKLKITSIQTS
ncbi:glycosyltransferase family 2 protein [Granulicella sp. S190]|uniref:glycosyltransferase family 2 protein n=1 Tax=Granulicella sp. S190 TaxID=1747226 RepID=UPI00131BC975|nr:glycosyltransferase family 2 protein [Granulicella sp. S190]